MTDSQYTERVLSHPERVPDENRSQAVVAANRKGIASTQLAREIGVTQKTAWFMLGRLREVVGALGNTGGPLDGTVEADETYVGGKEKNKHISKRKRGNIGGMGKQVAFALVERGGAIRSYHVASISGKTLRPIIVQQISRKSSLMTDEAGQYFKVGKEFASHEYVNHGIDEYVRGDCHTNTVENRHV